MIALYIIGILTAVIVFFGLGYYLWDLSMNQYDYNIFNIGVIIRGLIAIFCIVFAAFTLDAEVQDGSITVWLIAAGVMMLWTFITTLLRTNILIGIFSLIYQLLAAFFVFRLLSRLFR